MRIHVRSLIILAGLFTMFLLMVGPAHAQYVQLWNIPSTAGPDAATFDLGDETAELLFPATHHGSQGDWPGGPAHSARALARPGVGAVHGNVVLPYPAHTMYGDTDGDAAMEFVSDNVLLGQIVVWNGATGTIEARIPYPVGASQLMYIILVDVNAANGVGSCEIIAHWWGGATTYGTTCWGFAGGAAAPETPGVGISSLGQNAPNPFGRTTAIDYSLAQAGEARLKVYDTEGRLIRTLLQGSQDPGKHTVLWDRRNDAGSEVAAGVYYYELSSAGGTASRTAVVIE